MTGNGRDYRRKTAGSSLWTCPVSRVKCGHRNVRVFLGCNTQVNTRKAGKIGLRRVGGVNVICGFFFVFWIFAVVTISKSYGFFYSSELPVSLESLHCNIPLKSLKIMNVRHGIPWSSRKLKQGSVD